MRRGAPDKHSLASSYPQFQFLGVDDLDDVPGSTPEHVPADHDHSSHGMFGSAHGKTLGAFFVPDPWMKFESSLT